MREALGLIERRNICCPVTLGDTCVVYPRAQRFRLVASHCSHAWHRHWRCYDCRIERARTHTKGPDSSWWRRAARKTVVLPAAKRRFAEIRAQIDAFRHGPLVDGIPTPPPTLIQLVAGTSDLDHFLSLGRAGADTVTAAFDRTEIRAGRTLDFGCGCGRVARHLKNLTSTVATTTRLSFGGVAVIYPATTS